MVDVPLILTGTKDAQHIIAIGHLMNTFSDYSMVGSNFRLNIKQVNYRVTWFDAFAKPNIN